MKSTSCKTDHRINQNRQPKPVRNSRQDRVLRAARFKVMCADAGLTIEAVAQALHVTSRTVRYWFSGKVTVPYAAYRLVRILGRYELPDPAWQGWIFHSGKLWTPEGHAFAPSDSNWWGLLVRRARLFGQMADRHATLDALFRRTGRAEPAPGGAARGPQGPAQTAPNGEAGRAAEPPGPNLFKGHFPTRHVPDRGETPSSVGSSSALAATNKEGVSHG